MNKVYFIAFIILANFSFAQEKTYRFLYDFHQVYEPGKNNNSKYNTTIKEELNKSYEIEVFSNDNLSFIKLIDIISNSQTGMFMNIKPEPNWLLIDNIQNLTYEKGNNVNQKFIYLQDSIQTIKLNSTGNKKTILGIIGEEYKAETDEYSYSFWLADFHQISVSPIYFQFKNLIVLELRIISKLAIENGGKREMHYLLKDKKEEKFNFKKLTPKKFTTKSDYKKMLETQSETEGVEK